jgi:signal transduction histidine kinase
MIDRCRALDILQSTSQMMDQRIAETEKLLERAVNRGNHAPGDNYAAQFTAALNELRSGVRTIRESVYQRYSCDVLAVIRHTIAELTPIFEREGVELPELSAPPGRLWGLIRAWELGDIVDNALVNSLRAMRDQPRRELHISVESVGGRIRINVTDTGVGVPKEKQDSIFLEGVSESGGTGHGLAQARRRLSRFGGNIFLAESTPRVRTTFTIQINEGRENLEIQGSDHR